MRRLAGSAGVAGLLLLLAAALCWPFLSRPLEVIPGDPVLGECYVQPWSIWWVHREIFREGIFPFWTDLLYYPQGGTLFSQMSWNALLLLPLGPLDLPSPLLLNLSLFLTVLAGGVSCWLLLHHLTGDRAAAMAGSALFMTCPLLVSFFRSGYLQGLNLAWLPLAWLLYLRMWDRPTPGRTLAAASAMALLVLANLYAGLCAALLVGLHALWNLRSLVGRGRGLALFGLLAALLGLPILAWIRLTLTVSPLIFASRGISNETFFQYSNPDLARFFLPLGEGDLLRGTEACYLGFVALSFALFPLWRGRVSGQQALYGTAALVAFGLALGPYLVVDGSLVLWDNHLVRLPFYQAHRHLPLFEVVRQPQRLMGLGYLSLAVLVATNLAALRLGGRGRRAVAWAVGGLGALEYLFLAPVVFPVPVSPAAPADYSLFLREQPGRFAVLALPYSESFVQDGLHKHQQTYHGRSLQGGFDRRDAPQLDSIRLVEALRRLSLEGVPLRPEDPAFAGDPERLARLGFAWVVVDRRLLKPGDGSLLPGLARLLGSPRGFRDGWLFPLPPAAEREDIPSPARNPRS